RLPGGGDGDARAGRQRRRVRGRATDGEREPGERRVLVGVVRVLERARDRQRRVRQIARHAQEPDGQRVADGERDRLLVARRGGGGWVAGGAAGAGRRGRTGGRRGSGWPG